MIIDGKAIAHEIYKHLKRNIHNLKQKNITPHLVIFLIGNDPASEKYVEQKYKKGTEIGITVTIEKLEEFVTTEDLLGKIALTNSDPYAHGIIIQRPLPKHIDGKSIDEAVSPQKDVDGFHSQSPFSPPLAEAVFAMLQSVSKTNTEMFIPWLKTKEIVVMGKGETGGKPVIELLQKNDIQPSVIDSKTQNPKNLTQRADIIITAVGKRHTLTADVIKPGVILICVGMKKGDDERLHGDYEEEDIKDKASFYTPIPGGVGPVNVAKLLENVVTAADK